MAVTLSNKTVEHLLALATEGRTELASQRAALRHMHGFGPRHMLVVECDAASDALALITSKLNAAMRGN